MLSRGFTPFSSSMVAITSFHTEPGGTRLDNVVLKGKTVAMRRASQSRCEMPMQTGCCRRRARLREAQLAAVCPYDDNAACFTAKGIPRGFLQAVVERKVYFVAAARFFAQGFAQHARASTSTSYRPCGHAAVFPAQAQAPACPISNVHARAAVGGHFLLRWLQPHSQVCGQKARARDSCALCAPQSRAPATRGF